MNKDKIVINEFRRKVANVNPVITEARTKMSALELKIFYQVLTLIEMSDTEFNEYQVDILKFAEALKLPTTNREFLKETCLSLAKQVFYKDYDNKNFDVINIFSSFKYRHKEQTITVKFSEDIKPYLLNLKRFTKIQDIRYIKDFESKYAIRIYALLKDYRKMSERTFNIQALAKMLNVPESIISSYTRFYRYVLQPAIKEINEKSDLWVSEPEITKKVGKKIVEIRLEFGNKSTEMAEIALKSLMDRYKKYGMRVFENCRYTPIADPQNSGDIWIIKKITQENGYYIARGNDMKPNSCLFADGNKEKFLNDLKWGIYRAIKFIHEVEKKEKLPLFEWQEKQDTKKAWREIAEKMIKSWQKPDLENDAIFSPKIETSKKENPKKETWITKKINEIKNIGKK